STIGDHTFTVTATDKAGNTTTATHHYTVRYPFQGFFSPVSNSSDEELNLTHAGDLIRIGFGLGGDRGLDIFQAGFPTSTPVACPSWAAHLVNAAGPGATTGLSFSSASGHYVYGWQTSAAWAGTCREFQVVVKDGSARTATFLFFA
ncbi:MAG TPA: PxKF domain-containing protein, partial [Gaiellaceae bacterium]